MASLPARPFGSGRVFAFLVAASPSVWPQRCSHRVLSFLLLLGLRSLRGPAGCPPSPSRPWRRLSGPLFVGRPQSLSFSPSPCASGTLCFVAVERVCTLIVCRRFGYEFGSWPPRPPFRVLCQLYSTLVSPFASLPCFASFSPQRVLAPPRRGLRACPLF